MNQRGFALITALLVILVVSIIAATALSTVSSDLRIGGMDRDIKRAFAVAEGGTEEARARLNPAIGTALVIADNTPNSAAWTRFIGVLSKVQELGYDSMSANHARYDRATNADFYAKIAHKLNASNQPLKWGDANGDGLYEENTINGETIYVITSLAEVNSAKKTVMTEVAKVPPITVPAAVYAKDNVKVMGSSTVISGGTVPGILSKGGVTTSGNPNVTGNPDKITNSTQDMQISQMIDSLSSRATDNISGGTKSGQNWGVPTAGPTAESPTTCPTTPRVILVGGDVKFTGGTSGCGILLVKGNLEVSGGFQWYGPILTSGLVKYTGGGQKNVTGAILSGGQSALDDDTIGGNAVIIYSATAINFQTLNLPLVTLRWKEVF